MDSAEYAIDFNNSFSHLCVSILGENCLNPETLYEKSVLGINDLLISLNYFSMDNAGSETEIFLNDSSVWKWVDTQCEGRCTYNFANVLLDTYFAFQTTSYYCS